MRWVQPGQRIGKYVLGERIAIGGMAEVWAARVEGPQGFVKPLALKFMLESFAGDPELERLFVNEARVAAQLQHANIVSIFDFDKLTPEQGGGAGGRYYIAMERVEGRDLRQIALGALGAGQPFPRPVALYVAGEVLKGLRYVHERRGEGRRPLGLIHRDVSPHNVLVSFAGEVKLSDFGIAKTRAHSSSGNSTGNIRGKLAYASPEQLEDLPLDHRTDQFALGITLWELLAGRRLFEGADELEVMTRISRCQIPPFSSLPSARDVAPEVEAVVRRMLYRRCEDRYPTTADALSAVISLPGYSADGVPLGNLVKRLFLTQTDFPATGPLVLPPQERASVAASSLPPTQTIQPPPKIRTPSPREGGTRSVRPGASPGRTPSSRTASRTTRRVTGESGRRAARTRRPGWLLLIGGLALIGAAIGLWLTRVRSDDGDVDETPAGEPAAEQGRHAGAPRAAPAPTVYAPTVGAPASAQEQEVPPPPSDRGILGPIGPVVPSSRPPLVVAPFATGARDAAATSTDASAGTPRSRGEAPRGSSANAAPIVE